METIVQRIKQYADSKNLSIREMEGSIGAGNGTLGRALRSGTDISASWLTEIVSKYPDINPVWLITGRGSMTTEIAGNIAGMVAANIVNDPGIEERLAAVEKCVKSLETKIEGLVATSKNQKPE